MPRSAKAFYRRGDASYALGHFKDAVRDFRAAIRLAPSDPDLRRKVGRRAAACPQQEGLDSFVAIQSAWMVDGRPTSARQLVLPWGAVRSRAQGRGEHGPGDRLGIRC